MSELDAKLRWFSDHRDDFDAVFVGSSLVFRQIDPATFDQTANRKLPGFRSFNLGMPGLSWIEELYLIDALGKLGSRRLRYVFIDPRTVLTLKEDNRSAARTVQTHNFDLTALVTRELLRSELPVLEKARQCANHVLAFANNIMNSGALTRVLGSWVGKRRGFTASEDTRGFFALDSDRSREVLERRKKFLAGTDRSMAETKTSFSRDRSPASSPEMHQEFRLIQELVSRTSANGFKPIVIIPGSTASTHVALTQAAESGSLAYPVFSFVDGTRFPELFDPKFHWDVDHLNQDGARIYTRLVADRFLLQAYRQVAEDRQ